MRSPMIGVPVRVVGVIGDDDVGSLSQNNRGESIDDGVERQVREAVASRRVHPRVGEAESVHAGKPEHLRSCIKFAGAPHGQRLTGGRRPAAGVPAAPSVHDTSTQRTPSAA
jgi:hypothetical protein